jgi:hypothetical protein
MKQLFFIVVVLTFPLYALCQVKVINNNCEVTIGERIMVPSGEDIKHVDDQYVYTATTGFNYQYKEKCIAKYGRNDLKNIWRISVPKSIKHQKLKLYPDTVVFDRAGNSRLIWQAHDSKEKKLKLFQTIYSPDGKASEIKLIEAVDADNPRSYRIRYIRTKNSLAIVITTDYVKKDINLHVVLMTNDLNTVNVLSTIAFDRSTRVLDEVINEKTNTVFVLMRKV